jgi:hypothetical protein
LPRPHDVTTDNARIIIAILTVNLPMFKYQWEIVYTFWHIPSRIYGDSTPVPFPSHAFPEPRLGGNPHLFRDLRTYGAGSLQHAFIDTMLAVGAPVDIVRSGIEKIAECKHFDKPVHNVLPRR